MKLLAYVVILLLFNAQIAAAQVAICMKEDISRAAAQFDAARAALLDLPVPHKLDLDISPEAQQGIALLKRRLGDLVIAYMRCATPDSQAQKIEQDLNALPSATILHGRPTRKSNFSEPSLYGHGHLLEFHVERTGDQQKLIAVTASFTIRCGSDSVFLIFTLENNVWREILRWQSKPYKEVSGAFWSFGHAISPPDKFGNWYVVTKHISPWCTSNWRGILYSVLRPVPGSVEPREIFSDNAIIYLDGDDYGALQAQQSAFTLTFHGGSIDVDVHNRPWVKRFSVSGDNVKRIQPVAEFPRDFVDEWIVSPWAEAAEWSASDRIAALKDMHDRLPKKGYPFDYVSIRRCDGAPERHELALRDKKDDLYYFDVLGSASFTMKAVSHIAALDCKGTPEPAK